MTDFTGACEFFDPKPWIQLSDILVAADEPMMALEVLKMVPGFYRDHYPMVLQEQADKIDSLTATPHFYAKNKWDMRIVTDEEGGHLVDSLLRGRLIQTDVQKYNTEGKRPHVFDYGPGEYWLPIGLQHKGYNFTYDDVGLCDEARKAAVPRLKMPSKPFGEAPVIYVACEIIEHLHYERDLKVEVERAGLKPDIIHVSTPKYTFDGRLERLDWRSKGDLGHLRTYTPKEFSDKICLLFRGYNWQLFADSNVMHMRGEKVK